MRKKFRLFLVFSFTLMVLFTITSCDMSDLEKYFNTPSNTTQTVTPDESTSANPSSSTLEEVATTTPSSVTEEELKPSTSLEPMPSTHTHVYDVVEVVLPTCEEHGYTIYTCSFDGESYKSDYTEPLGHTLVTDSGVETTCTTNGLTEGIHCSTCNKIIKAQGENLAFGHQLEVIEGTLPTCTEDGLTDGLKCSICGEIVEHQEVINALGHTVVIDIQVSPTHTATGLSEGSHCSVCGEIIVEQKIEEELEHVVVIDERVDATCTTTGLTEGCHCSECGEVLVAQTIIPALGHVEVVDNGYLPTCSETGLTEGSHCSICGEVLTFQTTIDALGHSVVVDEEIIPTYEHSGLTEGSHCETCNEVLVEQEYVPALVHTPVVDDSVDPTCTTTGLTEGIHCSECEEVLVAQTVIEALGHTVVIDSAVSATCTSTGLTEGSHCSRCGEVLVAQEVTPMLEHEHTLVEGYLPTCTEEGLTEGYVCSLCGEVLVAQTVIPMLGHEEVIDEEVLPTCTTSGLTEGSHCSICNTVLVEQNIIEALGHNEEVDYGYNPTCEVEGLSDGSHCSRCNIVLVEQTVIEALGHDEIIDHGYNPTCINTGLTDGSHCSRCNLVITFQTTIKALGHNEVVDSAVNPTCNETGLTEGSHCSRCNMVIVAQTVVDALGHEETHVVISVSTCTTAGIERIECLRCNEVLSDDVITPALGHVYDLGVVTYNGSVKTTVYTCLNCSHEETYTETEHVHNYKLEKHTTESDYPYSLKVCYDCDSFIILDKNGKDISTQYEAYSSRDLYDSFDRFTNASSYKAMYRDMLAKALVFQNDKKKNAVSVLLYSINYKNYGLDLNAAIAVWRAIDEDYPLTYCISKTLSQTSDSVIVRTEREYFLGSVRNKYNSLIMNGINTIVTEALKEVSDFTKIKFVHDYIINNTDYAYDKNGNASEALSAHSVLGFFDNTNIVCEGYAKMVSAILNALGIENHYVTGNAGGGHAWNYVKLYNNWYLVDTTWDDKGNNEISYTYFMASATVNSNTRRAYSSTTGIYYGPSYEGLAGNSFTIVTLFKDNVLYGYYGSINDAMGNVYELNSNYTLYLYDYINETEWSYSNAVINYFQSVNSVTIVAKSASVKVQLGNSLSLPTDVTFVNVTFVKGWSLTINTNSHKLLFNTCSGNMNWNIIGFGMLTVVNKSTDDYFTVYGIVDVTTINVSYME